MTFMAQVVLLTEANPLRMAILVPERLNLMVVFWVFVNKVTLDQTYLAATLQSCLSRTVFRMHGPTPRTIPNLRLLWLRRRTPGLVLLLQTRSTWTKPMVGTASTLNEEIHIRKIDSAEPNAVRKKLWVCLESTFEARSLFIIRLAHPSRLVPILPLIPSESSHPCFRAPNPDAMTRLSASGCLMYRERMTRMRPSLL